MLIFVLTALNFAEEKKAEILAFCGSVSKQAMEECTNFFEEKSGIKATLYFSGSGKMLSQMKISKR